MLIHASLPHQGGSRQGLTSEQDSGVQRWPHEQPCGACTGLAVSQVLCLHHPLEVSLHLCLEESVVCARPPLTQSLCLSDSMSDSVSLSFRVHLSPLPPVLLDVELNGASAQLCLSEVTDSV